MITINDVVLIYLEDSPVSFARVESILPDAKKGWYHIKLLMLAIPLQVVTWILKQEYMNGAEFNMNGKKMRLETVKSIGEDLSLSKSGNLSSKKTRDKKNTDKNVSENIISFPGLKKNHEPESE